MKPGEKLSEFLDDDVAPAVGRMGQNLRGCYYQYEDGELEEIPTPDRDAQDRNPSLATRHWR